MFIAFGVRRFHTFCRRVSGEVKTRIRFPAGASSTAVKGTIRGYAYRDYIVRANADQTIAHQFLPQTITQF